MREFNGGEAAAGVLIRSRSLPIFRTIFGIGTALHNFGGQPLPGKRVNLTTLILAWVGAVACGAFAVVPAAIAQSGFASVYGYKTGRTASGERVNPGGLTAAHRSLPFGTHVRVTNRKNGKSVVVRINDRGPFIRGRVIDVTPAGARALGFSGLTSVSLSIVGR
jgi:rare lipoprotein A